MKFDYHGTLVFAEAALKFFKKPEIPNISNKDVNIYSNVMESCILLPNICFFTLPKEDSLN